MFSIGRKNLPRYKKHSDIHFGKKVFSQLQETLSLKQLLLDLTEVEIYSFLPIKLLLRTIHINEQRVHIRVVSKNIICILEWRGSG